ncbi:hypothetical protein BLOT_015908 [Blomia tropicalis]|nr:hypothetical protein BLOT_015908 [Blomia tropicalis]
MDNSSSDDNSTRLLFSGQRQPEYENSQYSNRKQEGKNVETNQSKSDQPNDGSGATESETVPLKKTIYEIN